MIRKECDQFLVVILILLIVAWNLGCSGTQQPSQDLPRADDIPNVQTTDLPDVRLVSSPPRRLEGASFDAAIEAARIAPAPEGVDPVVFNDLRDSLLDSLQSVAGKTPSALPSGPENEITDMLLEPDGMGGAILSWTYVNVGDYDLNGEVNISDLSPIGLHFGKSSGAPDWTAAQTADGDNNGEVNISDVTPIGMHFFASVQGYNIYGRSGGSGPYTLVTSVELNTGMGSPPAFSVPLATIDYDTYAVAPYDSTGEDAPQQTMANPTAEVIDPEVVQITGVTDDGVVLSGDASNIEVGKLIVSAEGEGLLRRVESITPVAGGVELTTSQGTLEDLFDYVRLDHVEPLPFESVTEFVPEMAGIEFSRADPPAGASDLRYGSAETSTGLIQLKVSRKLHDNLEVSATISFESGIEMELDIGTSWSNLGEIERFRTTAWVEGTIEGTIKALREFKLNESREKLGTLYLAPVIIPVGVIPVVITPEIEVWLKFTATGELGIETTSKGWADIKLGMEYTADSGWNGIKDVDYGFEDDMISSVYGSIKGEFSLISPELDLALYGVLGPYMSFDVPYIDLEAKISYGTESKIELKSWFGLKATVGAEAEVLGETVSRWKLPDIINLRQLVFSWQDVLAGYVMVEGDARNGFGGVISDLPVGYLHQVKIDFDQDGTWKASTYSEGGHIAKHIKPGTYDVICALEGFRLQEIEDFEVTDPMTEELEVRLCPEFDENTIMVEFTSHENEAEITEPFVLLEGQLTYGEIEPDRIELDFETGLTPGEWPGSRLSGFVSNDYTRSLPADSLVVSPEGTFSHPVYIHNGLTENNGWTEISVIAWTTVTIDEVEHQKQILTSSQPEPLVLNSIREPAALIAVLHWFENAIQPTPSHTSQIPGVPNEDFRLVVFEPGSALVAGQGPLEGLGYIKQFPGTWHWYYCLPQSEAKADDTFTLRALFYDSVWRVGTEADSGIIGNTNTYQISEVYENLEMFYSGYPRYPKAIQPIDPYGSGADWHQSTITIPSGP